MRHRKNNYGFNNFSFIKRKKISKYLIVICAILVTSLTIGFASFSSSLVMKNIAMIRIDKTVRLTGIKVNSTNGGAISRTEEYNVSNIFGDVVLPSKDSYVKYEVDITNLGNVKMGALTSNQICMPATTATTGNVPEGKFVVGDEYICDVGDGEEKTFFVLENKGDTVSLIMNSNVGTDGKMVTSSSTNKSKVFWLTKEDYLAAGGTESEWNENINMSPLTANKTLREYTSTWTNISSSQITLPTRDQVSTAAGDKMSGLPIWLYDYTAYDSAFENKHVVDEVLGYWTSKLLDASKTYAYCVENGTISTEHLGYGSTVASDLGIGVRPVITLSKLQFGLNNNLDYTIDDYNKSDVIPVCDGDNCTNGVTKKIYVTIKYKDGIDESLVTSEPQSFNIGFDYKQIFTVTYDGVTCTDCISEVVEGNTYTSTISLTNPRVTMGYTLLTKDTDYTYDETTKLLTIPNVNGDITIKEEVKEDTGKISNGQIVYFNVDTGKVCTDYTESQSETEVKSGCMKFYVFNDDGGDKVNLILDHNTTQLIDWNDSDDVTNGPTSLLDQLKTDTSSWKGTLTPTNYSHPNYTIDYTGYKARLITAEEVARITGNTSFDVSTDEEGVFYFDTNTSEPSDTCKYDEETETDITTGCNYQWLSGTSDLGYWTATQFVLDTNSVYTVMTDYSMSTYDIYGGSIGLRPVIEVPRSVVAPQEYGCKAVTEAIIGNVPSGSYNYGDEYTCRVGDNYSNTFFVLENSSDTVSLIMKENFTDSYVPKTLAWCIDGGEDNTTCKNITATGSNALTGKDYLGHIKSIFNIEGVEVSFPSASQIATASSKSFDDENYIRGLPEWLSDYLIDTAHPVSGVYGYWTTTPNAAINNVAWSGDNSNILYYSNVNDSSEYGVRPVITISKDLIN